MGLLTGLEEVADHIVSVPPPGALAGLDGGDAPTAMCTEVDSTCACRRDFDSASASTINGVTGSVWGNDASPADASLGRASSGGGCRFQVLRPHAEGGLGTVSLAFDTEARREVALKQILDKHADDPASRHRFLLEAELTCRLEHPGIVPVYGLGKDASGRPFYAMLRSG